MEAKEPSQWEITLKTLNDHLVSKQFHLLFLPLKLAVSLCVRHYQRLDTLREHYIIYCQTNAQQYEEAALAIRIIDYWRVLKISNYREFALSDIQPLCQMGEQLLALANHTTEEVKRKKLTRLVLLLQMLLQDHPHFSSPQAVESTDEEFFSSLSQCSEHASQLSEKRSRRFARVLEIKSDVLKDYKPTLAKTREHFQNAGNILDALQSHSQSIIAMLRTMLIAINKVLGPAPCDIRPTREGGGSSD